MDDAVHRTAGMFTTPPAAGDNNWKVVASANLSPSGLPYLLTPDIVWRNETSGRLVVWHMGGLPPPASRAWGEFTTPDSPTPALEWTVVGPK